MPLEHSPNDEPLHVNLRKLSMQELSDADGIPMSHAFVSGLDNDDVAVEPDCDIKEELRSPGQQRIISSTPEKRTNKSSTCTSSAQTPLLDDNKENDLTDNITPPQLTTSPDATVKRVMPPQIESPLPKEILSPLTLHQLSERPQSTTTPTTAHNTITPLEVILETSDSFRDMRTSELMHEGNLRKLIHYAVGQPKTLDQILNEGIPEMLEQRLGDRWFDEDEYASEEGSWHIDDDGALIDDACEESPAPVHIFHLHQRISTLYPQVCTQILSESKHARVLLKAMANTPALLKVFFDSMHSSRGGGGGGGHARALSAQQIDHFSRIYMCATNKVTPRVALAFQFMMLQSSEQLLSQQNFAPFGDLIHLALTREVSATEQHQKALDQLKEKTLTNILDAFQREVREEAREDGQTPALDSNAQDNVQTSTLDAQDDVQSSTLHAQDNVQTPTLHAQDNVQTPTHHQSTAFLKFFYSLLPTSSDQQFFTPHSRTVPDIVQYFLKSQDYARAFVNYLQLCETNEERFEQYVVLLEKYLEHLGEEPLSTVAEGVLPLLVRVLQQAPPGPIPRVGLQRLSVVNLVLALISCLAHRATPQQQHELSTKIQNSHLLQALIDLFFQFPMCNILHCKVVQIFTQCTALTEVDLLMHAIRECKLLARILECILHSDSQKYKTMEGALFQLFNLIVEESKLREDDWQQYCCSLPGYEVVLQRNHRRYLVECVFVLGEGMQVPVDLLESGEVVELVEDDSLTEEETTDESVSFEADNIGEIEEEDGIVVVGEEEEE